MITNPRIQSYYTDNKKQATIMKITGTFSPSMIETFECIVVFERKLSHDKWDIVDLWFFNKSRNQYESVHALYSYTLLDEIKSQVLRECVLKEGA